MIRVKAIRKYTIAREGTVGRERESERQIDDKPPDVDNTQQQPTMATMNIFVMLLVFCVNVV